MSYDSMMKMHEDTLNRSLAMAEQGREAKNQMAASAYNSSIAALDQNHKSNVDQTNRQYDASIDRQNQTTAKALKDAYVGKRLGERNIGQQLAALGRTGGAAESTLLGMQNNYQTNRAGLESERSRAIENFNLERGNALNSLMTALNTERAKANDLYQGRLMDSIDDYNNLVAQAYSVYDQGVAKAMADKIMMEMEREARAAAGNTKGGSGGDKSYTGQDARGSVLITEKVRNFAETIRPIVESGSGAQGVKELLELMEPENGELLTEKGKLLTEEDLAMVCALHGLSVNEVM